MFTKDHDIREAMAMAEILDYCKGYGSSVIVEGDDCHEGGIHITINTYEVGESLPEELSAMIVEYGGSEPYYYHEHNDEIDGIDYFVSTGEYELFNHTIVLEVLYYDEESELNAERSYNDGIWEMADLIADDMWTDYHCN